LFWTCYVEILILPSILWTRGVHFRFCSVFIKKSNQTEFFFKKTETEPKPVQTYRFRFGFLEQKPVQTGLAWFFWFGSVLARFFSGLARFFSVFFGSGSVCFFQNFNRFNQFFFTVRFFRLFFSGFLGLIGFSVFLNTPIMKI